MQYGLGILKELLFEIEKELALLFEAKMFITTDQQFSFSFCHALHSFRLKV